MKTSKATRNVRKFINAQNGRPPRVKSIVDDYGNRVHVVKGKVKHSRSLSENKKVVRKLTKVTDSRHLTSNQRRGKLWDIGKTNSTNAAKINYHSKRYSGDNKLATSEAKLIHTDKRKPKDFTK